MQKGPTILNLVEQIKSQEGDWTVQTMTRGQFT